MGERTESLKAVQEVRRLQCLQARFWSQRMAVRFGLERREKNLNKKHHHFPVKISPSLYRSGVI